MPFLASASAAVPIGCRTSAWRPDRPRLLLVVVPVGAAAARKRVPRGGPSRCGAAWLGAGTRAQATGAATGNRPVVRLPPPKQCRRQRSEKPPCLVARPFLAANWWLRGSSPSARRRSGSPARSALSEDDDAAQTAPDVAPRCTALSCRRSTSRTSEVEVARGASGSSVDLAEQDPAPRRSVNPRRSGSASSRRGVLVQPGSHSGGQARRAPVSRDRMRRRGGCP